MLVIESVHHVDVVQCVGLLIASLGSLVLGRPPPYSGYAEKAEEAVRDDLENDPHVHHMKVVDTSDGEIIAYAKYELYESGRSDAEKLARWRDDLLEVVDDFTKLRKAAHEYFSTKNGEFGKKPHLLLALLVTAEQHRNRGAGHLLVQWGISLSEQTGLPCYVQASAQGRRLYAHHGFTIISSVDFNLAEYGLEGIETLTDMIRMPGKEDMAVSDSAEPGRFAEISL